jgi:hypothetical protein
MYEDLSRLLAGELDASAEATLRLRIAADPALARAWADMSALPDLLGGLSFGAPPPALAARLAQMADQATFEDGELDDAAAAISAQFDSPLFDSDLFDASLFDSADQTMDPDADALSAPRHPVRARALARAPSSTRGREAFLDQLLAPVQRSARVTPATPRSSRRVGVTAVVAMMALAAGVVLGLNAPGTPPASEAPAAVAISEGTTTVDGTVDLRAGDVRVRVDGRARVTVTPDETLAARDASSARTDGAPYAGVATGVIAHQTAVATYASPAEVVRERIVAAWTTVVGAPAASTRIPSAAVATNTATNTSTTATPSAPTQPAPNLRVTVQVERGEARVAHDGLSVALAVGESRTFESGSLDAGKPRGGGRFDAPDNGTASESHDQRDIDRAVGLAAALARTSAGRDGAGREGADPTSGADTPEITGALYDEERLLAVLEGVPGADLIEIDCTVRPCIALLDYTGDDAAWTDTLGAALAKGFAAGVTLTSREVEIDGGAFGLAAVTVDEGAPEGVRDAPNDKRARAALRDIERELTE